MGKSALDRGFFFVFFRFLVKEFSSPQLPRVVDENMEGLLVNHRFRRLPQLRANSRTLIAEQGQP